jgi:hypothetical protein
VRFLIQSICSAYERMIVSGDSKVKATSAPICGAAPRDKASAALVRGAQR